MSDITPHNRRNKAAQILKSYPGTTTATWWEMLLKRGASAI